MKSPSRWLVCLVACTPVQREEPVKQAAPVEVKAKPAETKVAEVKPEVKTAEVKPVEAKPDEPTAEYMYGLITFGDSPIGSRPTLTPESLLLPTMYPEDCARADRAFLRLQLVDAWHSAGMAGAMVSETGVGGAAEEKKYATAAALFVDLYDTAVRELGAEDPLLATFYDYGHAFCDRVTKRSHAKSVCMPERKALERALALREAGFGSDHPLTNSSRVSLAGTLMRKDERRAEELLKAAAASRPGSIATISALRSLAALRLFRFENELADQAAAEAVQLAHDVLDREKDAWEYDSTLAYHARLAAAAGSFHRSILAYELVRKGDRGLFAYELAEVQAAAARYEHALKSYEADMASIEEAHPRGLDWYAASRMVRSAKGRVAMLERLGPAEELAAARERVKELEALAKKR